MGTLLTLLATRSLIGIDFVKLFKSRLLGSLAGFTVLPVSCIPLRRAAMVDTQLA
jgi:hypothetical protein